MDLNELLQYIPASSLSYQEWVNVGMALNHEGYDVSVWDSWSRADSRYKQGECERKWKSFGHSDEVVTGGTVYEYAKRFGYVPRDPDRVFDWDDVIEFDGYPEQTDVVIKDQAWLDNAEIEEPDSKSWNPLDQFRLYLQTLFEPEDNVNWVFSSFKDEDGRYKPKGYGTTLKVGDILKSIAKWDKKTDMSQEQRFRSVVCDYDMNAGMWIRFNPMDGNGTRNDNVSDYRYALVESDSMELGKQKALMEELRLPIAVMLHSGGKSIHAIVKIGAATYNEYKQKVDFLYSECEKNGLKIDTQNKNPSRLSRFPGASRGKKKQFIIATNIGCESFDEWKDYIEESVDSLPDIVDFADIQDNLPPLAPELIKGVLRKGHKMLIAGPSKAGKSFLLIELAAAIANGTEWIGHECAKGRVLYINFEVADASFDHRVAAVLDALQTKVAPGSLDIWSLRGEDTAINKLLPRLIRRAKNKGYSAIIIDPLYKINPADENSASEMTAFFNQLDLICRRLGSSVIMCHHHSKGAQGGKFSMDRASGSGVFARDPDAIMDMIQINPKDVELSLEDGCTAWRISYTVREFAVPSITDVIFNYPLHYVTEELKGAEPMSGADMDTRRERSIKSRGEQKEERLMRLVYFIENWSEIKGSESDHVYPYLSDALDYFKNDRGFSQSNIKKWTREEDCPFTIERGMLFVKH